MTVFDIYLNLTYFSPRKITHVDLVYSWHPAAVRLSGTLKS